MPDKKISALTAASTLTGSEVLPVVQSGTTKKATVDQVMGGPYVSGRLAWAAAGGALPSFGAIDSGGGATPIGLGTTGKVQDSSFSQIGKEVFAHARIVGGTGTTGGTGYWTLEGLPVTAKISTGNARIIGEGWFIKVTGADYRLIPLWVVVDPTGPAGSATKPVFYCKVFSRNAPDPAGLHSAAATGAVTTTTPEQINTLTYAAMGDFATVLGTSPIANTAVPFDFAAGSVLNVSLQFEAA